ncbi:E3 ubiquitin-protein ligase TRIM39-like [Alosa sapidissima]|uniref:E3 ubiquitin-protein ligase TRIM39-like n=1 Tax=Alosa sapidissima TaxID=34773 RepID=UPI001C08BF49|nr:E3 ubiquitin-protein ligase TRIM39-like [Alosa sapidissima]XP_041961362.1 E3 ubiquitin-protein ligase TRIM39-like [Alosa sapidissima]
MLPSTGHSELRSDLTQDQSRCGVCEQVLRDPVITTCGHSVCRQCIGSYWEQSPDQPRPLCEKRPQTTSSSSISIQPSTHTHSPTQHSLTHPPQHSHTAMEPLPLHEDKTTASKRPWTQSPLLYPQTSPAPYYQSPGVHTVRQIHKNLGGSLM